MPTRNDALDGLRLLAVAAVMAFHFGLPHSEAGFLGVDVFFVLSGYLITSLLLARIEGGRIDVLDFWTRRLRRLIPAVLALVGVVVVWSAVVAPVMSRDGLRGDITATLFYVANWHFISTSTYFANDGVASPLQHMWSLAVEEQFYLVWPLLLGLAAVVVRQPRRRLIAVGVIAGAGLVASVIRLDTFGGVSSFRSRRWGRCVGRPASIRRGTDLCGFFLRRGGGRCSAWFGDRVGGVPVVPLPGVIEPQG